MLTLLAIIALTGLYILLFGGLEAAAELVSRARAEPDLSPRSVTAADLKARPYPRRPTGALHDERGPPPTSGTQSLRAY